MTNPPAMPWVKLRTNYLEDVRFSSLDDPQKCRFFQLLMLAGRLDAGGYFIEHGRELTEEEIAWKLRLQEESLSQDLAALTNVGLTCKNGCGWCIPDYEDEQGPTQADKRQAWKERQQKHRAKYVTNPSPVSHTFVTCDNDVTHTLVTPLESESESESEKESEKESESSVLNTSAPETTDDDDQILTMTKTDLVAMIGIPSKFKAAILQDARIRPQDLLAELSRNFARKGTGKGHVAQPGYITAINLTRHEFPSVDWYQHTAWMDQLPDGLLQKCGFVVKGQDKLEDQCLIMATRKDDEFKDHEMMQIWQLIKDALEGYKANGHLRSYIQEANPINYSDNLLQIAVPNQFARQWLEERAAKTINRLLAGITNLPVTVEFIFREETSL